MKAPNFFIVGAPKSGTTAMSGYLGQHEKIFFCSPKEPCFFSTDFPNQCDVVSESEYFSLFEDANDSHIAVGEGSVWYLLSDEAIQNIYKYNKDAKILVMLRNPVEQVYSMHQELFHRRYEVEEDFISAWRLQEERAQGKKIPKHCKEDIFLQYGKIASYSKQVKRLFEIFPKDQIKIVIFDDFKKDTRHVYKDILEFLEVPDDGRETFSPSLESRRHKIHWLGTFLINQPSWFIKIKNLFKRIFNINHLGIRDMVAKRNTVVEKRAPLPAEFVDELKSFFKQDIDELSLLLCKDLKSWYK